MNKQTGLDLISIIRNVLHQEIPRSYENYEDIFNLAKYHDILGITYLGIKEQKNIPYYKEWKKAYDVTNYRNIHFEIEREIIFDEMKNCGLSYMPLKGVNLLPCYKDYGMRKMADNDILYGFVEEKDNVYSLNKKREKEAQSILIKIMKKLGYEVYSLKGKDDVFHKKPFYNFEMHRKLTSRGHLHSDYYFDPFTYAYQDDKDTHLYHLSIEEEYIYILEHAYKHYEYAGVGIRYLIDMYVYLSVYKEQMDFEYIAKQIEKLQMLEFYQKSYQLCMSAFDGEMNDEDKQFLDFLLTCGVYGTDKQQMKNRMKGNSKLTYLKERIFPSDEVYQDLYPFFYKYKVLLPFLPFYRLFLAIIRSPKRIWKEIKMLIRK